MNKIQFYILSFFVIFLAIMVGVLSALFDNAVVDFSILEHYEVGKPSIVLDDQGNEWARFEKDKRDPLDIEQMPIHLINAFVAAEDHSFFTHCGISFKGIARSLLVNLYSGKKVQGASTITQQLIKLLFVGSSRTFSRKIKEQIVAVVVEQQYSKDQIFQTYANHVYFGCGIYGVEAASQRFWSKSARDLTIAEAATLAGIVKSPGRYCPLLFPRSSQHRRNIVLRSMYQCGFISREQYEYEIEQPVDIIMPHDEACGMHLKEMIRIFLESLYDKELLYNGGLKIQTTINIAMQKNAEIQFHKHVTDLREKSQKPIDGALLCMEGKTGAVKALIGGYDFSTSQFNRATQAIRQIGSTIKPLVYAAALEQGFSFADVLEDEPLKIVSGNQIWEPRNDIRRFLGPMTRAFALSRSNNIVTIKTLLDAGCANVVEMIKRFRLHDDPPPYPSLALGCIDCSLEQACSEFNVFAQHGLYVQPFIITWVKDQFGTKIYKQFSQSKQILAPAIADQVAKVLGISIGRARARYPNEWIDSDAIGKTGTTNRSRTCWFIGSTPEYTTGIYIGCDDNQSLGRSIHGVQAGFPIWMRFYKTIPFKVKQFMFDQSLEPVFIHSKKGYQVDKTHPKALEILIPRKKI